MKSSMRSAAAAGSGASVDPSIGAGCSLPRARVLTDERQHCIAVTLRLHRPDSWNREQCAARAGPGGCDRRERGVVEDDVRGRARGAGKLASPLDECREQRRVGLRDVALGALLLGDVGPRRRSARGRRRCPRRRRRPRSPAPPARAIGSGCGWRHGLRSCAGVPNSARGRARLCSARRRGGVAPRRVPRRSSRGRWAPGALEPGDEHGVELEALRSMEGEQFDAVVARGVGIVARSAVWRNARKPSTEPACHSGVVPGPPSASRYSWPRRTTASTCSWRSSDRSSVVAVRSVRCSANVRLGAFRADSCRASRTTLTSGRSRNRPPPRTRKGTPARLNASSNSADCALTR